jgi:large subunit ribosomal protein L18
MARKIKKHTSNKLAIKARRRVRIRAKVEGSIERPRLCITKTNKKLSAQLIDDLKGVTLLAATTPKGKTVNLKLSSDLGKAIAQAAIGKGIQSVVFDRSGNLYHGRIKAVADGAREAGLKF